MPTLCTLWQERHSQGHPQTSLLRMSLLQMVSVICNRAGLLPPDITFWP